MQIINPATEEIITDLLVDDEQTILKKFSQLKAAQPAWYARPVEDRVIYLQKFSDLLLEEIESLSATLTSEVGKPIQQSRNEINGARTRIDWLLHNAPKYLATETMSTSESLTEKIVHEPLGVVCNISAWNYPYLVGVNVFIPALLAGNTVLYKPSEYASLTGLAIQRLLYKAGIPENCFNVAIGASEVGKILLNTDFDGYFFTGSYKTGKYIYETVAKKMVSCQCELGGKDPLYITNDIINIAAVAAGTADGVFYNNGQSCCAVERIYVHEEIANEYITAFVKEVESFTMGDPTAADIYLGALTRKEQITVLENQITDALNNGATLLTGGKVVKGKGYYFEPTVLSNVTQEMRLMQEESFGPIIGIATVKNDEEAIEKMKDTQYGLTAGVYSNDEERALKILAQLPTGTGYWNCCDRVSAPLPWSGRKNSGIGATLSYAGIRAFTQPKAYHLRKS